MPDTYTDNKQWWRRRTTLEKKLVVGASILGLLALIFLLIIAFRKSCEEVQDEQECTTSYCAQAAAELLDYIDLKQDPCKNFYRYACGTYYKNAVTKDSPSPWTYTETLFENEMKMLVVDEVKKKDTAAHIALKQFYHSCMNESAIDEDENRTFMDAIDELGEWPITTKSPWNPLSFDWADWYIEAKQMGLPVIGLFGFKRVSTIRNDTVLRITGPEIKDKYYTLNPFIKVMEGIAKVFDAPHDYVSVVHLHAFIFHTLYHHRAKVERKHINYDDDGDDDFKGVVLGTIQNLTEICPEIPFVKILNGISGNTTQFNSSSEIVFDYENLETYCPKLEKYLKGENTKELANFFVWSIIQNAHIYMDKNIRRVYEDYDDEDDDRFELCYKAANKRFKYVKETVYVRKKTLPQVKEQLQEMIDIMKDLYKEHLEKADWMDEETKQAAVEKAELIESVIGADDELYDIEEFDKILGLDGFEFTTNNTFKMLQEKLIKEDHHFFETVYGPEPENWPAFFKNAVEVNAFFLPPLNVMVIPAPILTSIFYNRKFPAFMNYGFMGSTVGHEFMHGFSKDAREVLLENDTVIDWWTNATSEAYDKKIQCVIDEYESIPFRYRLNGTLTLNENVADYVGADLGYEAYKRYVEKHGIEMKLPGVPLTPEQIYWVKTSTNFCFRKLDDNEIDYEEEDEHAIPAFRIQAPARNSYYFAEAFNCPVGSFMNPEEKCQIL